MTLKSIQDRFNQEWVPAETAAQFYGSNPDAIGVRQLGDFIRHWNAKHPAKPILKRRGAVELRSLAFALKERYRPRRNRASGTAAAAATDH